MLDDVGHRVDRTESKLGGAMHRMQRFIRETEGEFSSFMCLPVNAVLDAGTRQTEYTSSPGEARHGRSGFSVVPSREREFT